jgi:hypothetical protein
MTKDADTLAALAQVEDAQAALRRMLRGVKPSRLALRPPSGEWSPMENVRHLIFAEQHHFGESLPRGFRWSSAGAPPPNRTGERRLNSVGSDPATTIDEVFDAWSKVHAVVRARCLDTGDLARKLEGNLSHVNLHIRAIERLLGVQVIYG